MFVVTKTTIAKSMRRLVSFWILLLPLLLLLLSTTGTIHPTTTCLAFTVTTTTSSSSSSSSTTTMEEEDNANANNNNHGSSTCTKPNTTTTTTTATAEETTIHSTTSAATANASSSSSVCDDLLTSSSSPMSSLSFSPLQHARALTQYDCVPKVSSTTGGEMEHLQFWEHHDELFRTAWKEWSQTDPIALQLPSLNREADEIDFISPKIYQRIHDLWNHPTLEKEQTFQKDFFFSSNNNDNNNSTNTENIPGVYVLENFLTPQGVRAIRQHLHAASSGRTAKDNDNNNNNNNNTTTTTTTNHNIYYRIPTRRPNGMNRYGLVLDDETPGGVSYPEMNDFLTWLVDIYVRPLGRMLFPEYIGSGEQDDASSYAFTIQYSANDTINGDLQLKEHSDASVITMNINLNYYPKDDNNDNNNDDEEEEEYYEGSSLLFRINDDDNTSNNNDSYNNHDHDDNHDHKDNKKYMELSMKPGMAVLHRGLHRHQALPIQKGQRHQLIIWLFGGTDGYVRFVPYPKHEQMSVEERWSLPKSKSSSLKF